MEKIIKILVASGAVWLLMACNLFAGLTTTLYIQSDGQSAGYRDPKSVGGEFTGVLSGNNTLSTYILDNYSSKAKATVTTTVSVTVTNIVRGKKVVTTKNETVQEQGIETFCVEMTETMSPGTPYTASLDGNTISPGAKGARNYLTMGTAYLYSQFAQGKLSGYDYTSGPGREVSADELQDAIWYLQGEMTTGNGGNQNDWDNGNLAYSFNLSDPTADPFVALAEQACGNSLAGAECTNTLYYVQVLELTCGTQPAQDQLIYCPVPEPGTLAAGALFLVPLGWSVLRRFHRKTMAADMLSPSVGCKSQPAEVVYRQRPERFWRRC